MGIFLSSGLNSAFIAALAGKLGLKPKTHTGILKLLVCGNLSTCATENLITDFLRTNK
ncbi:MAG: hypothetical protein KAI33_10630 [Elusimicrobiales bacterium]|nr:hypothetical protein [Elusimicrobiales bacterium]